MWPLDLCVPHPVQPAVVAAGAGLVAWFWGVVSMRTVAAAVLAYLGYLAVRCRLANAQLPAPPPGRQVVFFAHGFGSGPAAARFFTSGPVVELPLRVPPQGPWGAATHAFGELKNWAIRCLSHVVHVPLFGPETTTFAVPVPAEGGGVGERATAQLFADEVLAYLATTPADGPPVLLVGHSRGGATVVNAATILGAHPRLKGVVAMGVFATVRDVLAYRFGEPRVPLGQQVLRWMVGHDPAEPWSPLARAPSYPKDMPLLLVGSRADRAVPLSTTLELHKALPHARMCTLATASHEYPFVWDAEDRRALVTWVRHC